MDILSNEIPEGWERINSNTWQNYNQCRVSIVDGQVYITSTGLVVFDGTDLHFINQLRLRGENDHGQADSEVRRSMTTRPPGSSLRASASAQANQELPQKNKPIYRQTPA